MKIEVSARTHTGLIRKKNEDNLCICNEVLPEHKAEAATDKTLSGAALLGVFDGMGGFEAGETASLIAAQTASTAFRKRKLCKEDLSQICIDANRAICDYMERENIVYMGTTASMLCIDGEKLMVCNVGDSPIYHFRNGSLRRMHMEHSERAMREALLGEPLPQNKKFKLTQYIGMPPEEIRLEPYLTEHAVQAGDCYLICSDGVSDMIDDEQIRKVLAEQKTPAAIAEKLITQALKAGGKDNATVICVQIKEGILKQMLRKMKR